MRTVVLSGFMATGKSTVGPALAARLGVAFVDTDSEIVRRAGKSIPALWHDEGEASFRLRESALIEALLADPVPKVIAFGGGAVTVPSTRRLAIDQALIVTLTASAETIVRRTPNLSERPNLASGTDALVRARELLAARVEPYSECHLSISSDGRDPSWRQSRRSSRVTQ
jgi:shikimate kinase